MKKLSIPLVLALISLPGAGAEGGKLIAEGRADNGSVIRLYNSKGVCEKEALEATFHPADGGPEEKGCWKAEGGVIKIVWFDVFTNAFPLNHFSPPETL